MTSLSGKCALVTGGGRGIGAAAAEALAAAGARVAVAARNEDQVVEVAARLRRRGHDVYAFRCDVTLPMDVRDLALSAREALGQVDILVNNAGTATSNPLDRVSIEEWNHLMAVNATGTFLCTKAVLSGMKERRWGRVVNVASVAGLEGAPYISAYTAAKHAVVGFTLLALNPVFLIIAGLHVLRRSITFGLTKPTNEMLYSVVSPEARYKAKNFIETAVYRGGDVITTWTIRLISGIGLSGVALVCIPIALFWAWLAVWIGGEYRRRDKAAEGNAAA